MKKRLNVTMVILLFAVMALSMSVIEHFFADQIHKNNMVSSPEELGNRITEELDRGHESFSTYVNGIGEDELHTINEQLDGFFGSVSTYTVLRNVNGSIYKVRFDLKVSDNYYAYRNLLYGEPIMNNTRAEALATKVQTIMDEVTNASMSDYEKELAYHDYLTTNCSYGFIEGEDEQESYKAYGALVMQKAVCNGYAEAMELLLRCSNIDAYLVVGQAGGVDHAWNIINLDGKWYHFDATWDDPVPDQGNRTLHAYFNISDAVMSHDHIWNQQAYPECNSMEYNYYIQEGLMQEDFNSFKDSVLRDIEEGKDNITYMVTNYAPNGSNYDMNFIFDTEQVSNISWQTYGSADYVVIAIDLTYYDN